MVSRVSGAREYIQTIDIDSEHKFDSVPCFSVHNIGGGVYSG